MIITLKGADFSKNNIGPLSSWLISREIGDGARYSGPAYVTKGGTYTANVVLGSGYKVNINEVKVFMNEVELTNVVTLSEDEKTLTITIVEVTGNVIIKVPTNYSAIYYMITHKYLNESGESIRDNELEQVLEGTEKVFALESAPAIKYYTIDSIVPDVATIYNDMEVIYNYIKAIGVNLLPIDRYFVGLYLKDGLLTNGSTAHRAAVFYLPEDGEVTFKTDYAATRTDFTFLAKYTSNMCNEVEKIILQTPDSKTYTGTFNLEAGFYGLCWSYGSINENPENEMSITTPGFTSINIVDFKETGTFVTSKYMKVDTGVISPGSANYGVFQFEIDKTFNGGVNIYQKKASTRFANIVKFTDSTYSTVDRIINGTDKAISAKILLEPGYYGVAVDNSNGASLSDVSVYGYEYL